MVVRFDDVHRHFGRRPVLQGIRWAAPTGKITAIQGPNGSGKTTLLRLAAGVLRPTRGRVMLGGDDIEVARERPGRLAVLLADAPVYPELTPNEQARWWLQMHGAHTEPRAAVAEAGLAHVADRPARTLSRGQRQRLALAMAFGADTDLLLLDEPFTALDDQGRAWLKGRLANCPATVLMAVHEDGEAALADHRVALRNGRLEDA